MDSGATNGEVKLSFSWSFCAFLDELKRTGTSHFYCCWELKKKGTGRLDGGRCQQIKGRDISVLNYDLWELAGSKPKYSRNCIVYLFRGDMIRNNLIKGKKLFYCPAKCRRRVFQFRF